MGFHSFEELSCSICSAKPVAGRGLCHRCYYRLRKRGELLAHAKRTPEDTFMSKIAKSDGCWTWLGTKNSYGYGIILLAGEKPVRAHRFVYEQLVGPIPEGAVLMHSCDNPICVNPAHLSVGTRGDNNRDATAKQRNAFGERNGHCVLSKAQIDEIRASTEQQCMLARKFGVTQSHISRIKSGKARTKG